MALLNNIELILANAYNRLGQMGLEIVNNRVNGFDESKSQKELKAKLIKSTRLFRAILWFTEYDSDGDFVGTFRIEDEEYNKLVRTLIKLADVQALPISPKLLYRGYPAVRIAGGPGPAGDDGDSSFLYVGYAEDASGTGYATTPDPSRKFVAFRQSSTSLTVVAGIFTGLWNKYVGDEGDPGAPGDPGLDGDNGESKYLFIGYASDASGTGFTLTFDPALKWVASLTKTVNTPPLVAEFAGLWAKYIGEDGTPANTLLSGTGVPSNGFGNDGDFYIDYTPGAKRIYGPKTGGLWDAGEDIKGDAGDPGDPGTDGDDGDDGADSYIYIAFADTVSGGGYILVQSTDPDATLSAFDLTKEYIAFVASSAQLPDIDATTFDGKWARYKGDGDRWTTTSSTSLTIATGTKVLTTAEIGLSYVTGQRIVISVPASPGNLMEGTVIDYNPMSGTLTADITSVDGAGTYSLWYVSLQGATTIPEDLDRLRRLVTMVSHGFVLGNVLTVDGSGDLVLVSDPATEKFVGIVQEVIDVDSFVFTTAGYTKSLTGLALTPGTLYYAQTDGTLDTTITDMLVLLADTALSGYILASSATGGGGGSGTVTGVSAADLSPLFTTVVNTPTTTPAIVYAAIVQNQKKFYSGPASGADAAPTFRLITVTDIPDISTVYLPLVGGTLTGALILAGDPATPLGAATKQYVDAAVVGLWDDRGTYNPVSGNYPSSGGSGTAGAVLKGDIWTINATGTLPTGQVVEVGDVIRALVDTPGNTQANWAILQNNLGYTPENAANKSSTIAGNETSTVLYTTAKGVVDWIAIWWAAIKASAQTITAKWTFKGTDDSSATYCADFENLTGDKIMRVRNDRVTEFPGSTTIIEVDSSTGSGNASLVMLTNMLKGWRFTDGVSDMAHIRTSTGDKAFVFDMKYEQNSGLGFVTQLRQYSETVGTVAGASTLIAAIPIASGESFEITLLHAKAVNSTFRQISCNVIKSIGSNNAGTLTGVNETITMLRQTAANGGWSIVYNDTDDQVEVWFTNESGTGYAYSCDVQISICLR